MKAFQGRAVRSFSAVGAAIRKARATVALFGAAVGISIGLATREFVKFEDALLDLQKVMLDTEGSAKQFIGVSKELSNTFGKAASEVLQGAANFKQAGFTVQESFRLQEVAMKGATASELSVIDASRRLTRILKGFKAPASEAQRAFNLINAVSNKFATSFGELATGMAQFSPIAKLMNFSLEETAAVLTPIIEVFGSGAEAAVALRTSMLRLTGTQSKTRATLKALLVDQKNLDGSFKSGRDILFEVMQAFQLLDDNQKIFVAQQLTGIRQAGRAVEVFNGYNKVLEVHKVALEDVSSLDKEVEVRLKSLGIKLGQAKQAFVNMAISVGAEFAPKMEKAAELTIRFINSFREGGRLRVFTNLVRGLVTVLGGVVNKFAQIARFILNINDALNNIGAGKNTNRRTNRLTVAEKLARANAFPSAAPSGTRIDLLSGGGALGTEGVKKRMSEQQKLIQANITAMSNLKDTANETAGEVQTKAEGMFEAIQGATTSWANSFADTLTDVAFGAKLSFNDILNSFSKMLLNMFIKTQLIQPILGGLFGQSAGFGATGVGIIGNLLGTKVQGAAEGGLFMKPSLTAIAEKEPELAIPLSKLGGIGGGGNVEINVFGATEATRVEQGVSGNGGRKIDIIIDEEVAGAIQPGSQSFKKISNQFNNIQPALTRR